MAYNGRKRTTFDEEELIPGSVKLVYCQEQLARNRRRMTVFNFGRRWMSFSKKGYTISHIATIAFLVEQVYSQTMAVLRRIITWQLRTKVIFHWKQFSWKNARLWKVFKIISDLCRRKIYPYLAERCLL